MTKVQLDYSTRPKRSYRRAIAASLAAVAALCCFCLFEPAVERLVRFRLPFLRLQNAALKWTGPAGQIAYDEDPTEANQLSGGKLTGKEFTTLSDGKSVLAYYSYPSVLANYWSPEWGFQLVDQRDRLLLLHRLQCKGGEARLVCVRISNFFGLRNGSNKFGSSWETMGLECTVLSTATLNRQAKILKHFWWTDTQFGVATPRPVRIYFGTPDPADDSKFSICFQTASRADVIEGQLLATDALSFVVVAAPESMQPRRATTSP